MIRAFSIRTGAAILAAVSLAGCALLSSPEPVQLYRFGDTDPPASATLAGRTNLVLRPVEFPAAARGDRILTVSGGQVAFLAGGRWVSPAEQLFTVALEAAFLRDAQRVSVTDRRETPSNAPSLDIDITSFEARYPDGVEYAPTVTIAGRARIVGTDRTVLAERTFMVEQPAAENRVSAVVAAYDLAVARFNTELVTWTDASAG